MSRFTESLAETEWFEDRIKSLRDRAFDEESDARKHRAEADALELELVEQRAAANILREVGLTVGRDPAGVPWVKVERQLAPLPETPDPA